MEESDIKERIRRQAKKLIMQYGVRSISMDDIAGSLGISKKTIYLYYADKDELVEAVVIDLIRHNQEICETDRMHAEDAIHELYLARVGIGELLSTINPSLLFELQKYHPKGYRQFQQYRLEFLYNMVLKNILRGMKEEIYRDDLKPELVSRLRVESLLLPFNPEFQEHTKFSVAEVHEELIELYLFSLLSSKGHKLALKYKRKYQKNK